MVQNICVAVLEGQNSKLSHKGGTRGTQSMFYICMCCTTGTVTYSEVLALR